jgi:hypothetical protein
LLLILSPHPSLPPVSFCCLAYPFERTWHACPVLRPVRVLPQQVPLGQPASLHCLCRPLWGLIRQLLRYYQVVRLPLSVHHWLGSLDFPMRPLATLLASGKQGISRFPCKVFSCMRKGFDRAGSVASRVGDAVGVAFRIVPLRRHPGPLRISRLNTWPARTPVNASTAALLLPPHDSGPVWSATPSPYGSLIHDTLPVCPALSGRSQHLNIKMKSHSRFY